MALTFILNCPLTGNVCSEAWPLSFLLLWLWPCSPLPRVNAAGATAPPSPRGWNLPEPWEQSYSEGLLLLGDKKTPCRSLGLTASSPTGLRWVNFAPEKGPRQLVEEIGIEDRNNGRHHPVS